MAVIQFENGTKVNFEGNPTPQDVEHVAKQMNFKGSGQPSQPSFIEEEKGALKKAWDTAKAPQDIASLGIGGGAIANVAVNIPFKHAVGAVASIPGVKQALTPFAVGMESLKQNPIHQKLTQSIDAPLSKLKEAHPRGYEAVQGLGDMTKAGLTVSSLGQGYKSVKDFVSRKVVQPQQVQGIQNTLTQNLGVNPSDAKDMASILDDVGVSSHVAKGNYDAAQWMLNNAHANILQTVQGGAPSATAITDLANLEKAARFVEGLKAVPFNPTALSKAGTIASGLASKAKGLVGTSIHNTAKWGPLIGGGGLLYDYLSGRK